MPTQVRTHNKCNSNSKQLRTMIPSWYVFDHWKKLYCKLFVTPKENTAEELMVSNVSGIVLFPWSRYLTLCDPLHLIENRWIQMYNLQLKMADILWVRLVSFVYSKWTQLLRSFCFLVCFAFHFCFSL